jgi:hypothetical protein
VTNRQTHRQTHTQSEGNTSTFFTVCDRITQLAPLRGASRRFAPLRYATLCNNRLKNLVGPIFGHGVFVKTTEDFVVRLDCPSVRLSVGLCHTLGFFSISWAGLFRSFWNFSTTFISIRYICLVFLVRKFWPVAELWPKGENLICGILRRKLNFL